MNWNTWVTLTWTIPGSAASLNAIQRAWAITKSILWYSSSQQYGVFSKCLPSMQIMTVWYVTLTPISFYRVPYTIWMDNKRLFPLPRPQAQTTWNLGQTFLFAYTYYHTGWSHWCLWDWMLASCRQSNCTQRPNLWRSFVLYGISVTWPTAHAGAYAELCIILCRIDHIYILSIHQLTVSRST